MLFRSLLPSSASMAPSPPPHAPYFLGTSNYFIFPASAYLLNILSPKFHDELTTPSTHPLPDPIIQNQGLQNLCLQSEAFFLTYGLVYQMILSNALQALKPSISDTRLTIFSPHLLQLLFFSISTADATSQPDI